MLNSLRELSAVFLGVHSCFGSELSLEFADYPELEDWDEWVQLPPLGSIAALTELCIVGWAALPPDFRQLCHLRRLAVLGACSGENADEPFEWGTGSLTGLPSLTRLDALQPTYADQWPSALPGGNVVSWCST